MPTDVLTDSLININGDNVQTLEILALTTLIAVLPSMLVMMTSFARYIISLSFLRTAMGTNQTPPNVVLVGIAMFLTLVQAGERYLLVGAAPSGISLVAELTREEAQALYVRPADQPVPPSFGEALRTVLKQKKPR